MSRHGRWGTGTGTKGCSAVNNRTRGTKKTGQSQERHSKGMLIGLPVEEEFKGKKESFDFCFVCFMQVGFFFALSDRG